MEAFPTEIWEVIFGFACTDDGSTGRSLSLLSREVHEIVKPFKLQSLCAIGSNQVQKFSYLLAETPERYRNVRYLFIADSNPQSLPPASVGIEAIEQAFYRILRSVANTLLTLHVHFTSVTRLSMLPLVLLPSLLELSLHGPFMFTTCVESILFASLRRLHVTHLHFRPPHFFTDIFQAAPGLTHLRFPQHSSTPYNLLSNLGIRGHMSLLSDDTRFPSRLTRVLVEVEWAPKSSEFWEAGVRSRQYLRAMENIARHDDRVSVVRGHGGWVSLHVVISNWLDRNCGKEGCWEVNGCGE